MSGEYCIYLRKSRADEGLAEQTVEEVLSRHEKALLELGGKMNLNITKIYREVVSGDTIASRPVVQELLASVEGGCWDGVLVMEVERLARGDTIDQGIISQTFKYSNTKIITPVKTYNPNNEFDEEYFEFGLFMSRREYKVINRRLQRGRIASVKEGNYLGSRPPYGYRKIKIDGSKGYSLEVDEDEAKIVKLIFELYTCENGDSERIGVSKICRKLQDMGIKPRYSDVWAVATVRGILTNPVYIGKIRWDYRKTVNSIVNGQKVKTRPRNKEILLVDGIHKPIIDTKIFDKAQYYISQNKATPIGINKKISNPLSGLIVCSECGHKMVGRPYSNNTPKGLICTTLRCNNIGSALYLVENRILAALKEWLEGYSLNLNSEYREANSVKEDIAKSKLLEVNSELKKLDIQMNSLYDFLEQGIYTSDIFLERSRIIAGKKSEYLKQKEYLKNSVLEEQPNKSLNGFIPRTEKILSIYNELTDAEAKNRILKEIIERVVYTKHKKGTRYNADNFEIVIYPKIPNTKIQSLPK